MYNFNIPAKENGKDIEVKKPDYYLNVDKLLKQLCDSISENNDITTINNIIGQIKELNDNNTVVTVAQFLYFNIIRNDNSSTEYDSINLIARLSIELFSNPDNIFLNNNEKKILSNKIIKSQTNTIIKSQILDILNGDM